MRKSKVPSTKKRRQPSSSFWTAANSIRHSICIRYLICELAKSAKMCWCNLGVGSSLLLGAPQRSPVYWESQPNGALIRRVRRVPAKVLRILARLFFVLSALSMISRRHFSKSSFSLSFLDFHSQQSPVTYWHSLLDSIATTDKLIAPLSTLDLTTNLVGILWVLLALTLPIFSIPFLQLFTFVFKNVCILLPLQLADNKKAGQHDLSPPLRWRCFILISNQTLRQSNTNHTFFFLSLEISD